MFCYHPYYLLVLLLIKISHDLIIYDYFHKCLFFRIINVELNIIKVTFSCGLETSFTPELSVEIIGAYQWYFQAGVTLTGYSSTITIRREITVVYYFHAEIRIGKL